VPGIAALLAAGADVNVRNNKRQTPLHMAAEAGMVLAVEHLVQVKHAW
jgi:ankyrin repeat protein